MSLDTTGLAQLAYDRSEIADTLFRYAAGLDRGDSSALASAVTDDCVFDFTPAAKKLGLDFRVLIGGPTIVETLVRLIGPLDTSHTASNIQVEISGDTAKLKASMLSQHFLPGDGPRLGSENALLMNRYEADLIRDGAHWRFRRVSIDNVWAEGDPTIIMAMATLKASRSQSKGRNQ